MITIPIAAPNKMFQWESSLFQFAQEKIYGADSRFNSLVLIVDRNNHNEIVKDVNWNLRIPYKIVNGIHTILDKEDTHPYFAAGNVFFALKGKRYKYTYAVHSTDPSQYIFPLY